MVSACVQDSQPEHRLLTCFSSVDLCEHGVPEGCSIWHCESYNARGADAGSRAGSVSMHTRPEAELPPPSFLAATADEPYLYLDEEQADVFTQAGLRTQIVAQHAGVCDAAVLYVDAALYYQQGARGPLVFPDLLASAWPRVVRAAPAAPSRHTHAVVAHAVATGAHDDGAVRREAAATWPGRAAYARSEARPAAASQSESLRDGEEVFGGGDAVRRRRRRLHHVEEREHKGLQTTADRVLAAAREAMVEEDDELYVRGGGREEEDADATDEEEVADARRRRERVRRRRARVRRRRERVRRRRERAGRTRARSFYSGLDAREPTQPSGSSGTAQKHAGADSTQPAAALHSCTAGTVLLYCSVACRESVDRWPRWPVQCKVACAMQGGVCNAVEEEEADERPAPPEDPPVMAEEDVEDEYDMYGDTYEDAADGGPSTAAHPAGSRQTATGPVFKPVWGGPAAGPDSNGLHPDGSYSDADYSYGDAYEEVPEPSTMGCKHDVDQASCRTYGASSPPQAPRYRHIHWLIHPWRSCSCGLSFQAQGAFRVRRCQSSAWYRGGGTRNEHRRSRFRRRVQAAACARAR
jgi:hypothetical protein